MRIEDLVAAATDQAIASGFTVEGTPRIVDTHVALITTEVAELYEAHRDGHGPTEHLYEHGADDHSYINNSRVSRGQMGREVLGKPVGIPSELADIVIRVCNMAGEYNIDLNRAIAEKMAYNATRPRMHGRKH